MDQNTALWLAVGGVCLALLLRGARNSVNGLLFKIVAVKNVSAAGADFIIEVLNTSRVPIPALSLHLSGIVTLNNYRLGDATGWMDSIIMPGQSALMPVSVALDNVAALSALVALGVGVGMGGGIKVGFFGAVEISSVGFPLQIDSLL